jgi:hypothetical protein
VLQSCSADVLQRNEKQSSKTKHSRKEKRMKHLNLQLERLEQRIAPGGCSFSSGAHSGGGSKAGSGGSKAGSGGSKAGSGGSKAGSGGSKAGSGGSKAR